MRKLPEITDRQRQAIVSTFNFEHKDPQLLRLCCAPKVCGPLSLERLRAIAGRFVLETEALVGAGLEGCEQLPWPRLLQERCVYVVPAGLLALPSRSYFILSFSLL